MLCGRRVAAMLKVAPTCCVKLECIADASIESSTEELMSPIDRAAGIIEKEMAADAAVVLVQQLTSYPCWQPPQAAGCLLSR